MLLHHIEDCWLLKGQFPKPLVILKEEVSTFLRDRSSILSDKFDDKIFIYGLSYLSDISDHLNNVNLTLQDQYVTIIDALEKTRVR